MELELNQIWIDRPSRQRKEIAVDDLLSSIPLHGVLVPIIVTKEQKDDRPYKLIAGERRYTACKQLMLPTIPVRLIDELSPIEQRIVELEENLRRKDLGWQDQCIAIASIHECMSHGKEDWTLSSTAEAIGYHPSWVLRCVRISKELHRENVKGLEKIGRAHV